MKGGVRPEFRRVFAAILEAHPRVLCESYRREYASIVWNDDAHGSAAWCEGERFCHERVVQ